MIAVMCVMSVPGGSRPYGHAADVPPGALPDVPPGGPRERRMTGRTTGRPHDRHRDARGRPRRHPGQRPRGHRSRAAHHGLPGRREPVPGAGDGRVHEGRRPLPRPSHPRTPGPVPHRPRRHPASRRAGLRRRRPALLRPARARVPLLRRRLSAPPREELLLRFPARRPTARHHRLLVGHRRPPRRPCRRWPGRGRPLSRRPHGRVDRGRGPLGGPHRASPPAALQGGHRRRPALRPLPAPRRRHGLLPPQGDRLEPARVRQDRPVRGPRLRRRALHAPLPLSVREALKHL